MKYMSALTIVSSAGGEELEVMIVVVRPGWPGEHCGK